MEGYHGSLEISDIVELVERNKYKPNITWHSSRPGMRSAAPAETCTMVVGSYLLNRYGHMPEDHVTTYNINTPFIPERSVVDPNTGRVLARGWRGIITEMVLDRVIRPSREVEKLLGVKECEDARHKARIMA